MGQTLSFLSRTVFRRGKTILTELSLMKVYSFPINGSDTILRFFGQFNERKRSPWSDDAFCDVWSWAALLDHYENTHIQIYWKILLPINENFQIKNFRYFLKIFAQNIDCGYSLEPPHLDETVLTSTHNLYFWAEIRKNNVYPCKPQFNYIKVGFNGSNLYRHVFVMLNQLQSNLS